MTLKDEFTSQIKESMLNSQVLFLKQNSTYTGWNDNLGSKYNLQFTDFCILWFYVFVDRT